MPILLLLCVMLACLEVAWPAPWLGTSPGQCIAVMLAAVGGVVGLAGFISYSTARQLHTGQDRERILRRYLRLRYLHFFSLLAVFALLLYGLGWGWAVQQLLCMDPSAVEPGRAPLTWPGSELAIIAPLLAMLVGSWLIFFDVERLIHRTATPDLATERPYWSRAGYVWFHLRMNLAIIALPATLNIGYQGLARVYPGTVHSDWFMVLMGVGFVALILLMPIYLRLLLGLRSLPAGPVRDRLEATARRLRFRCTDLLVWDTSRGVANAMIVGLIPQVRYVLFTDRLLAELEPEELEAVLGHEVGHVKHGHMFLYMGLLLGGALVLGAFWSMVEGLLNRLEEPPQWLRDLPPSYLALGPLATLAVYVFLGFGFMSRRCERQADIYGSRAVSCQRGLACTGHDETTPLADEARGLCPTGVQTMINALERVAMLNGMHRRKPGWLASWQHSTIAKRCEFLEAIARDPEIERRFQRRLTVLRWAVFAALAAAMLAMGLIGGWEFVLPG
jgi:STE24 endopeptidase